jgi:succinoglycan biosynthesis transport protein ExoP
MNNMDIGFYILILKRRLPYVLVVAVLASILAVCVALLLPPLYIAGAKILLEAPQIPASLARSTVASSPIEQLQVVQQQITTRDALLALAAKLDIYSDSPKQPSAEDIVKDMRGRIKFDLLPLDAPGGDQGATVVDVFFDAENPLLAAKGANEVAAMILATNQRQRTDRAGSTLQFFDQEVAGLDIQLKRLEADILKFKNENKDTLPDGLEFRRNQQSMLQERFASLAREETDLRSRRNTLIATYSVTDPYSGVVPLTPQQQMLSDLNRALAQQLTVFREDSPNIKALRAQISTLQQSLIGKQTDEEKDDAPSGKQGMFGLDLQLADIDNRLKAIARERLAVTQRMESLTRSIAATPATETVLNSFLRNYQNVQTQYNSAIARRAEASTGEQIEIRSDGGRFSLLEDAIPPSSPVAPKRRLIVAIGGIGGLGLGLALVVLLEMLNKTVRRPKDVAWLLQTPPLGTIPTLRTNAEVRAANVKRRVAALLSASLIPASLTAIHYFYMPLNVVFEKLMSSLPLAGAI